MPNFDNSLIEWLGFSHIINSEFFNDSVARQLMSSKFPIGVETMYKPVFIISVFYLFIFLYSCSPVNYPSLGKQKAIVIENKIENSNTDDKNDSNTSGEKLESKTPIFEDRFFNTKIQKKIFFISSSKENKDIIEQFINVIELAVYKKEFSNLEFEIKHYDNHFELINFLNETKKEGKIFIGPLNSRDTEIVNSYCDEGAIFFSFSSQRNLANKCTYLVNFFLENELREVFNFFPENSKVAILYPENNYGYSVNNIIDEIAEESKSILVNRASYSEDMHNVREAIKELGKYELRKYELNRQKKLLAIKNDEQSKKRLQKLERFKTTKDLDFTHIIIADYGIRLLQVAPLLPYYDIDPNQVMFVGTGAWDDEAFFYEPSLQGSIFPGIEKAKRKDLFDSYLEIYENKLLRISTLPYDLIGLISYSIDKDLSLYELFNLLNSENSIFAGVDGGFYFKENIIERDLDILQITNGSAKKIN